MEVIILAGGLGTRLRSVVSEVPKCMAPVAEKPFLWYLLKYIARFDTERVILSVGYLREVIMKWVEEVKAEFPFEFEYAIEEKPMGTGGGIRLAMEKIQGNEAVILNGDTFFDVDLSQFMKLHHQNNAPLSIALKPMVDFERYGNVEYDPTTALITRFMEKQPCQKGQINGGVYMLQKASDFWEGLPEKFSFETEILQKRCGPNGIVNGYVFDNYFIDIGIPEDYAQANIDFKNLFTKDK